MADPSCTTAAMVEDMPTTPEGQQDSQLHSSPIRQTWHPVDTHKDDKWRKNVYPHVNTEIEWHEMILKLCPTYQPSDGLAPKPTRMRKTEKGSRKSAYCDYLNQLSNMESLQNDPYVIDFRPRRGNNKPLFHPTRTLCHPDILAVRQHLASSPVDSALPHWSHLEATGEEESAGQSIEQREAQEGAYTVYHLQARPDLVSVPGIFVSESYFKLFYANACQVFHTPAIRWTSPSARKLLYAWMWRLYHPECDPSITVDTNTQLPAFTIVTNNKKHEKLVVLQAGESIGRRTIVLARFDPDSKTAAKEQVSNIIIKEQFIETFRRFREGPILEKIHKVGWFPGVVRLDSYEYVKNGNGDQKISVASKTVTRQKTRLVLKDRGGRLVDAKTIRELLMGIHDALETSRILFRKCKIVHRDISPNNVLLDEKSAISTDPLRRDLDDMCFSEYLLRDPAGEDNSDSESDLRCRLTTRVITIDFDSSQDQEWSPGAPIARTDTPIFMARMVRNPKYPAGMYRLPSMLALAPELLKHHQGTLKARLEALALDSDEVIEIPSNTVPSTDFQHLLRYDAESMFWTLLYCCIQAQPAEKLPEEHIPDTIWSGLTGRADARDGTFVRNFPNNCLHSSYAELVPLLDSMSRHLQGDLAFSNSEERKGNPEYIHEAFQRLILNFLVANNTKPFMDLKKSDQPRSVEENPMGRSGTTLSSNARRIL